MSDDRGARGQGAVEQLAADLEALRQSNGAPSFRTLARRSGCISHSTLHEATTGYRMPSWETVEQFVTALGADPEPWRERWAQSLAAAEAPAAAEDPPTAAEPTDAPVEAAPSAAEHSSSAPVPETTASPPVVAQTTSVAPAAPAAAAPQAVPAPSPWAAASPPGTAPTGPSGPTPPAAAMTPPPLGPTPPSPMGPTASGPSEHAALVPVEDPRTAADERGVIRLDRRLVAIAAAILLFAGGVLLGRFTAPEAEPAAAGPTVIDGYRAGDTIEELEPLHPGDAPGSFEDVTLPDGSEVAAGESVEKIWRIGNGGSVPWEGRAMVRTTPLDATGAECETPLEVAIPDTAPGETAEITVPITVTSEPGTVCRVEWKMVDGDGESAFPNGRPIFFLLYVV